MTGNTPAPATRWLPPDDPVRQRLHDEAHARPAARIRMPALRERDGDIPQIVDFCLQNLVKQRKVRASKVSPEAMSVLVRYIWPGNVRELENVIYRSAVIAQGDTILFKDLPSEIRDAVGAILPAESGAVAIPAEAAAGNSGAPALTLTEALDWVHRELSAGSEPILERLEREMALRVLKAESGNQLRAAEKLGITRATLRKRIDEWGIKIP
jgi:two-component system nitrogen regulation response regulator GlnG